jgi:lactate dehydrogenase-like 2-hydroxyacid dehydrogenase
MHQLAILDDYQRVAHSYADWSSLEQRDVDVTVFNQHLATEAEVVETLQDAGIIIAMRERTPFPGRVLEKLPRLKLLVTTGAANASIDVGAASRLGITVCGTGGSPTAAPSGWRCWPGART